MTLLNKTRLSKALELAGSYLEDRGISVDPKGKHAHDLWALSPTGDELVTAAHWAQTHDPSQGFRSVLLHVLTDFGVENADNQLSPSV